ncbi:hypothetical protein K7X08_013085 [Anisodus acutangulus]|uniref:Glabrous enhancer-binding protein-like DBD domain-containing protein n=1 Tax=Anisodus acutangulus TaxID=402998 RepID=A0A9Q1RE48_9SOLA|nr:hypothetical protein K7X08_013085 [Anisodus acutangulus]
MPKNHTNEEEVESGDEEMEVSSPGNPDTESESDSDSDSDSESEPEPKKPPVTTAPKNPQPQQDSSSEESESEPEPNPETKKPNPVVNPINEPKKPAPTKPRSKPTAITGAKRAVGDTSEAKESKRSKKKPENEIEKNTPNEYVKRQLFKRLWSEDDEIVILKGMIDYRSKKKADPIGDLSAFHEFIKISLQIDVSKTQLQDKIRRLKKKYENNAGKEKKGKERIFTKPHEGKAYELSKKIWGKEKSDNKCEVVVKVESNAKDNGVLVVVKEEKKSREMEKVVELKGSLSLDSFAKSVAELEKWIVENSGLLSVEKRNEMKEKFGALKVIEFDLCLRRVKLIDEQGEMVREALKDSGIEI